MKTDKDWQKVREEIEQERADPDAWWGHTAHDVSLYLDHALSRIDELDRHKEGMMGQIDGYKKIISDLESRLAQSVYLGDVPENEKFLIQKEYCDFDKRLKYSMRIAGRWNIPEDRFDTLPEAINAAVKAFNEKVGG